MASFSSNIRADNQKRLQLLSTVVAAAVVVMFVVRLAQLLAISASTLGTDLASYFDASQRLWSGRSLYQTGTSGGSILFPFVYPPLLALFFLPFQSYQSAWWAWAAGSIACWVGALWLIVRELRDELWSCVPPMWRPVLLAGLTVFPPVLSHLIWGQVQLHLLMLLTGAWLCLRRRREAWAGVLIGIAIAIKLFPVLVVIPLVMQRRWRAAGVAIFSACALIALSFAVVGWEQVTIYLQQVMPRLNKGSVVPDVYNHAIVAVLRGFMGSSLASWLSLVVRLCVVGVVALSAARRNNGPDRALTLGMTAMVLVPPLVWQHYFVLLYLPFLEALVFVPRHRLPILLVAFGLVATASLAYNVPLQIVPAAVSLPIGGALLLLSIQVARAWRRGSDEDQALPEPMALPHAVGKER
jgi:alpha-1,2-mannosyltransferase